MNKRANSKFNNNVDLKSLFDFFSEKYIETYRTVKAGGKTQLIKYCALTFKKWYYSTLLADTILSPANIFNTEFQPTKTRLVSGLSIRPVKSGKSIKNFTFDVLTYSPQNHPITSDLRLIVERFVPDYSITKDELLDEDAKFSLMESLSLYDPFYVDYLVNLAFGLKLIKKAPAIHTNKAQAIPDYVAFFKKRPQEQLDLIIKESINISALNLSQVLPNTNNIFTPKFIMSLLQNPCSTDEVFQKVYSSIGIDIINIMKNYDDGGLDEIGDEDGVILSSTFFLGVMLDQWFLTPFSCYLRLIQPLYFFRFLFQNELYFLVDDINSKNDVHSSLFAPCTYYSITPLGEVLLLDGKKSKNIQEIDNRSSIAYLLPTLLDELSIQDENEPEDVDFYNLFDTGNRIGEDVQASEIYEMKIKLDSNKRCWKVIEVQSNVSLHEFHTMISYSFNLDPASDYCFYHDKQISLFSKYSPPWSDEKSKKAELHTIGDVFNQPKQRFLYVAEDCPNLEVEFVKVRERIGGIFYPRVTRRSKEMIFEEERQF